ncbi:LamG domain-containing protein [Luteolibacter sp. Populi]|uniref:LamG domain-containing protein n=1 Tax=Luteolibacter sp. Populi TaxID=3230487 RepID=UPI0034670168
MLASLFTNLVRSLGVLCLLLPFSATTQAAVTAVRYFHFGDADPGIEPGDIAITIKDSASANTLTTSGSPLYTGEAANEFSDRAVLFNGTTQRAATPGPDTLTTDFGVEAWVKPAGTAGKQVITYCGTPGVNGWGLIQQANGEFAAEFGGVATLGGGAVAPGTWTHVAFVVTGGTATFYVNGVQAGPAVATPPTAPGPGSEMTVAAATGPIDFFGGQIDKLRVFIFATGAFAVEDLLYTPPLALALTLDGTHATGSFPLKHWLHHPEATTDLLTIPWAPVSGVGTVGQNYSFTEALAGRKFYRLNLRSQDPYLPPGKFIIVNSAGAIGSRNVTDLNAANANRFVGSQSSSIDASAFVDPANVDGGAEAMKFHWIIRYPGLDSDYTAKGMTGYHKPVLSAIGNSYATQPNTPSQNGPGVHFLLTVSSKRTGRSTTVDLRAQVIQSTLTLTMYNDCQTAMEACGTCICTIAAALPEDEPTGAPGRRAGSFSGNVTLAIERSVFSSFRSLWWLYLHD